LTQAVLRRLQRGAATSALRQVRLGGASVRLGQGRATTVRIRLTPAGRRALTRLRRLRVRVSVSVAANGRRPVTLSRTLTLRAP
jgi:hypothetical protein